MRKKNGRKDIERENKNISVYPSISVRKDIEGESGRVSRGR